MNRTASLVPLLLVVALQSGCGEDTAGSSATPRPAEPLTFTGSGGCGDAYFWAANPADDRAVTVGVALRDRSSTAPTILDVTLPDPRVDASLLKGEGLTSTLCNDVVQGEVTGTTSVTSGRVVLTVDPPGEIGRTSGTAVLTDLVAEDGTRLPDTTITTELIGFYAG